MESIVVGISGGADDAAETVDLAELEAAMAGHLDEEGNLLLETGGASIEKLEHGVHSTNSIMLESVEELDGPEPDKA